jgi:hypothetical protein
MVTQSESADQNLELLAKAFETLAVCTNRLVKAGVRFEPAALDLALNYIGRRFFFATPERRAWQEDQYRHWIQDAPNVCQNLIDASYRRTVTKNDVALLFKAPPPD